MSKLLDKKEEVFNLKLTSYGKYLLGAGGFKPTYYAFLDDNILYDAAYAGLDETQSAAQKRIKEDTQYLESLILFQDLEDYTLQDEIEKIEYKRGDVKPRDEIQVSEFYRFDQLIGDAFLLGDTRVAPSWKVAAIGSAISSSHFMDTKNNTRIPQINVSSSYVLRSKPARMYERDIFNSDDPMDYVLKTPAFSDGRVVYMETHEPTFYIDEVNTQILNKNFDLEVFEFVEKQSSENEKITFEYLKRKYYNFKKPQIINGIMLQEKQTHSEVNFSTLSTQNVEYYFNITKDKQIDPSVACKFLNIDKQSYYIDIDFDCELEKQEDVNVDIYGAGTFSAGGTAPDPYGNNAEEPEICQD
jgi:hypothetical protein